MVCDEMVWSNPLLLQKLAHQFLRSSCAPAGRRQEPLAALGSMTTIRHAHSQGSAGRALRYLRAPRPWPLRQRPLSPQPCEPNCGGDSTARSRCTTLEPTLCSAAILRIPLPPRVSAAPRAASFSMPTVGLLIRLTTFLARSKPALTRARMSVRSKVAKASCKDG